MTAQQKKDALSDEVSRLVALRDSVVSQYAEAIANQQDPGWILDTMDDVLFLMHEQGVDRLMLEGCRNAVFRQAREVLSNHGCVAKICETMKGKVARAPEHGHVYVLQDEGGMVKIGRTATPSHRIHCIRTQSGKTFTRVYVSPPSIHYAKMERHLHKLFKSDRKVGEWFDVEIDLVVDAAEQSFAEMLGKSLVPVAHNQIGE